MIRPAIPEFGWDPARGRDLGVTVEAAVRDGRYIDLTTTIAGTVHKKVMDTEERFLREGLIKLGWTPPPHAR